MPLDSTRKEGRGNQIVIELPTLHSDQVKAYQLRGRFKAIRCGRRYGKTLLGEIVAANAAANGQFVGWFSPMYRYMSEAYTDLIDILGPAITRSNKMDGVIRLASGGRIDFWTLDNPHAGRSRRYHKVIIDEAAFTKNSEMFETWRKAIRPTLVDFRGSAMALSNTNGIDPENFFYRICTDPELGWVQYHAPTHANPYMPREELLEIEARTHPLVYQQEYLAEFVDFRSQAFFALQSMLVDDRPVAYPKNCDGIFVTIDTGIKDKSEHDGTAAIYWALDEHGTNGVPWKLTILDYDIMHVQGSLLETWLPTVYQRAEELARQCKARFGSLGAWIEDKVSGTILLQQAARRGWPATAIDSKLTDLGKDARAISVSGYVHQELVKISDIAYDRQVVYKEVHRNHLLSQVTGFRIGIDNGADDLTDAFAYGVAIALGDKRGF